ncbi:sensor histidine kinase [Actinoplanes sp. HUAS TT8]|uniref:sensor histidine kinase n=1 Tax=Actinoplanes sp. HUAS TT8 TaxID=3447453 RepID=UPI003F524DFF
MRAPGYVRRWRSGVIVALVLVLGVLGTALSAVALHESAQRWSRAAYAQKQDLITKVVMAELGQYGVTLADLSASMGAQPELDATSFAAITAPINSFRLPGAIAVGYVVAATDVRVGDVQTEWRRRGGTGLTLTPAAGTDQHYFTVLTRTLDGSPPEVGGDLAATPEVARTLRKVLPGGLVEASPSYRPPDGGDPTFTVATSVLDRSGKFDGWVTMTFRGRDFLGPGAGMLGEDQVAVKFVDVSADPPITLVSWSSPARTDPGLRVARVGLPADNPHWMLVFRPTVELVPASQAWLARGALIIGGVLTLLLTSLTATVVTSRDRALRHVDRATAALRHDIERRETVEQQLRIREEELVGFAGVIAHDLRNPLSNVIGYSELIYVADQGGLSEKQQSYLTRVRGSAALMQRLIDDLLDYATADNATLRITEIDLDQLVGEIVTERLDENGANATIEHVALPTVPGDPTLIRQVLDNLIGNAIKYTPLGQKAQVTVEAVSPEPGICRVEVADRGIGIPPEQHGEVFNAFTRAEGSERYPGTGLGLAIVQRIVQRHGGAVGVESNPGGGSRFWFTLPTVVPD